MEWVVFSVFALAALAGAGGVVLAHKPVHAALSLVLTLFSVAVFFVEQEAHFLAAVQVIVYAGAIVVLFLFVIMLLGVDQEDISTSRCPASARWRSPSAWPCSPACSSLPGSCSRPAPPPAGAPPPRATSPTSSDWPAACSPTSSGRSRSPRRCWSSPWSGRSSWPAGAGPAVRRRRRSPRHQGGPARGAGAAEERGQAGRRSLIDGTAVGGGRGAVSVPGAWYLTLAGGAVHHRRRRPARPAQRAGDVHVRRADAQRRQPDLRDLRPHARRHRRPGRRVLRPRRGRRRGGRRAWASSWPSSGGGPTPPPTTSRL